MQEVFQPAVLGIWHNTGKLRAIVYMELTPLLKGPRAAFCNAKLVKSA